MSFRIEALPSDTLQNLFALSEQGLRAIGAQRLVVEELNSTPCRISLEDAVPGEPVILAPYIHQPARSPFYASGPIFVRQGARRADPAPGEVPRILRTRLISLRAYDDADNMIDAEVVPGEQLAALIERYFANPAARYLHAHFARRGCYATRVARHGA